MISENYCEKIVFLCLHATQKFKLCNHSFSCISYMYLHYHL